MKSFGPDGPKPVPKLLLVLSAAVLAVSSVILLAGALKIGVTWDEAYHVQRYDNYAESGYYLIDAQTLDGEPYAGTTDHYVYGPATMFLLHGLNEAVGVDGEGEGVATTAEAYLWRHVGIVAMALATLVGVVLLGRMLLRRWDWGVVAAASLGAMPMWTGHAMFNLKDVPVACGYVWLTVGLCSLAGGANRGRARRAAGIAAIAAGTFLMVGTRPGMWTALFASVVMLGVGTLLRSRRAPGGGRSLLADLTAGLSLAAASLLVLYPQVFAHPLTMLVESASSSANFLGVQASRLYVPGHLLIQMPLLLLGFILVGTVVSLGLVLRGVGSPTVQHIRIALVGVQLLALPAVTMIKPSALYIDLRQLLFAAPAAAVLAAVGIAVLLERRARARIVGARAVVLVASAGLVLPVMFQISLFPYAYSYANALGSVYDVVGNPEYYRGSGRALVGSLPPEGRVVCSPSGAEAKALRVSHLDGAQDCRTAVISPIAAFADRAQAGAPPLGDEEFWALIFGSGPTPANCTFVDEVSRRVFLQDKRFSLLARCSLPYPELTAQEQEFGDRPAPIWGILDDGWFVPAYSPDNAGPRTHPDGARIAFRLPVTAAPVGVVLRVAGGANVRGPRLILDGVEVVPRVEGAELTLVVENPAGIHRIEFLPPETGPLSLVLESIHVREVG